ncbi:MAG: glutamate racemase [Pseudohongiellaceae bacterium]
MTTKLAPAPSTLAPVGVFDSGIGGLSILREITHLLPRERFVYFADLAYSPYGNKTAELVAERCQRICDFLVAHPTKALVAACNSATAVSIAGLRQNFTVPIIGVEPGIKPAIGKTLSGVVGIMATEMTVSSPRFKALVGQFSDEVQIIIQPCPGLADAIELGDTGRSLREELLRRYMEPLLAGGVDTLVLGCTHYPLVIDEIAAVADDRAQLIDTSEAIARQVVARLELNGLLNADEGGGGVTFYSSRELPRLNKVFSYYWPGEFRVGLYSD